MARPSSYTVEVGDLICEQLMEGMSLRKICDADGMPRTPTVLRWLNDIDTFRTQYTRAREEQAETLADQIIDIADDSKSDTFLDENGNERTNTEVVARARLRVEARKWVASKLKPKKYGDKVELAGEVKHAVTVDIAPKLTKEEWMKAHGLVATSGNAK